MIATTIVNDSLQKWVDDNLLPAIFHSDKIIEIKEVGKFLLVDPKSIKAPNYTSGGLNEIKENILFDEEFQIMLSDEENNLVDQVDFLLFQFGNRYYYTDSLTPEELKEFKFLGKANLSFDDVKFPFIGCHTGYELCNGSRETKDWIKKAKFLNTATLGICEANTLAGTLAFQEECLKSQIKPIIGETITILTDTKAKINIKLYCENETGWKNLLWINKLINVDNGGEFIKEDEFWLNCETDGLICVLTPEVTLNKYLNAFKAKFSSTKLYFQLDFSEWSSQSKDEQWLKSIKDYFDNYLDVLEPILISDAYYLDKEDHTIKKYLNNIGKVGFKNQSKDQYFKSIDEIYLQVSSLFAPEDERWNLILEIALENLNKVCEAIYFKIPTKINRFPEYEMSAEEKALYSNNEEMFMSLIYDGLEANVINADINPQKYLSRIEKEVEVIKFGNLIDYFLILNDIIRWCKTQDILVGIGRGSSAGSLVNYCLSITNIDPIKYNLLFERFLNKSRVLVSKADIDTDFPTSRRDEVKRYIETKYGIDYVASIGTYSSFKAKGGIKDLGRELGADYNKTNFVCSLIDDAKSTFTDLFKLASQKEDVKKYIQRHYKIFEHLPLCLNQPKAASVHASGVIIVPKQYGNIYAQMPVKKVEGLLVSEWEGDYIDAGGFLKADILGIKQLDKLSDIMKLIEVNHGVKITFEDIDRDMNNPEVMELFKDGLTSDVFQFGTVGLSAFCKELKPDNIEDLIAAVSLYRPGPMDSGMHRKYVKIKHGLEKPVYDEGTEEITKTTYAQIVYQEQVMEVFVKVGSFNLIDADSVRAAMGKKQLEKLIPYKEQFINNSIRNGYNKERIIELYNKMEAFAQYAFNRSHAASYAITGYYCQWFKANYPIEFWTISLQYAEEKDIINRISEINKISKIQIASCDINLSTTTFFADRKTKTIYWALNSIKWVGDKAVEEILQERREGGSFYSIEEFCDRMNTRKASMKENDERSGINKRTITNLILAGAFDKVEKITEEQRGLVIKKYFNFTNQKLSDELLETSTWKPYQWVLKQKELTGFGYIDYLRIVRSSTLFASKQNKFKENADILFSDDVQDEDVVISGIVQKIFNKPFKGTGNRGLGANLEIIDNGDLIRVTIWMDKWETIHEQVIGSEGKIIILSGRVKFDAFRNCNSVQSTKQTLVEII